MHDYFIDREARDTVAEQLRHLAAGMITNRDFEESLPPSRDRAVRAAELEAWGLYDDLHEHKLIGQYKLSAEARSGVARLVLFLKTDQPWPESRSYIETILGAVVLVVAAALTPRDIWPFLLFGALLISFAATHFVRRSWRRHPDREFWPFGSREAYEGALQDPRYLGGKLL